MKGAIAMLGDSRVAATIPILDLVRARSFYQNVLGLSIREESPFGILFDAGQGTSLFIFPRGDTERDHTLAAFEVADLEATMRGLQEQGVAFDDVDIPGVQQGGKVAELGPVRSAWFRDSEGNVLSITQRT
jgi:catechol 2,3-dioxygenase-like lactoylglutathione lyase family enzyme